MTDIGARDRLIAFYAPVSGEDDMGTATQGFAAEPAQRAWAKVLYGTGAERREAGQAGSRQSATFRVLSTTVLRTVTETWEIGFDGARWGISSIAPVGEQGHEIEFTAIKNGA